ncbi:metal-dependent hydrolase [Haladaptatus sp. R4]|uniref:metal-dependent hydrolase n=1 Tax=Haladaptatus sp. R4 TaxID=1679489 RepID=UPI00082546A4|nr:metal-dependent hydrolase [Haladaptatus sp. R4]
MMVGHALLAFGVAALVARRFWSTERALAFGVVAGVFATVPDVDMTYAVIGLVQSGFGGVWRMTAEFWGSAHLVHRAVTHSLVVAAIAGPAFVLATGDRWRKLLSAGLLAGLVWIAFANSGFLGAGVMSVFVVVGTVAALVADSRTDLGPRELVLAAVFGLMSHPFGDVFTGAPPQFFYPFDVTLLHSRVAILSDPTLNLLAIFGLEVVLAWFAVSVYFHLSGGRVREQFREHIHPRAALGVGYALAALVIPAPTLSVSYQFVFSVLAVGAVGVGPQLHPERPFRPVRNPRAWLCTGMAAVTLAAVAYAAVYQFA